MNACCRNAVYLNSTWLRFAVPDALVSWHSAYPGYAPPHYDAPVLAATTNDAAAARRRPEWADPPLSDERFEPKWNTLDGSIDRRSHAGPYVVVDNVPQNPVGRTGLRGRGLLGRWGPNHAADPIITRWKRTDDKQPQRHPVSGRQMLHMVAIRRRDTGEWAIPGGMVEAGQTVAQTLRREFAEEALNSHSTSVEAVERFFDQADDADEDAQERVYGGYVDDPRNTDNAWMETVAWSFHDTSGKTLAGIRLEAGDDAAAVRWMDVDAYMKLYANHKQMVAQVAKRLEAHW